VSPTVETLVMVPHDRTDGLERPHRSTQLVADRRMPLHARIFGRRQSAFLEQNPVRNGDFADVVEEGAAAKRVEIGWLETEMASERRGTSREAIAVSFGIWIARLYHTRQREKERLGEVEVRRQTQQTRQRSNAYTKYLVASRF